MTTALTAAAIYAACLALVFAWSQWTTAATRRRLNALRRNCFLTDEKGHRRKWADCSDEVRERAEV